MLAVAVQCVVEVKVEEDMMMMMMSKRLMSNSHRQPAFESFLEAVTSSEHP